MVVLDTLRYINHVQSAVLVEEIVLREITMDQVTFLVERSNVSKKLEVDITISRLINAFCVFEPGSSLAVLADECHHENVTLDEDRLWTRDGTLVDSFKISDFLFSPEFDELSWIALAVSFSESELPCDVFLTIFEHENRSLEDLNRELLLVRSRSVIDVGFLACGQTSIDLVDDLLVEHFHEDNTCPRIQYLLDSCTI